MAAEGDTGEEAVAVTVSADLPGRPPIPAPRTGQLAWWDYLPALIPVLVFALGVRFFGSIEACNVVLPLPSSVSFAGQALEVTGRYTWGAAALVMIFICLAAVVFSTVSIGRYLDWRHGLGCILLGAGLIGLVLLIAGERLTNEESRFYHCLGKDVFAETVGKAPLVGADSSLSSVPAPAISAGNQGSGQRRVLARMDRYLSIVNIAVIVAGVFVIIGAMSTLARFPAHTGKEAYLLAFQFRRLRNFLYFGSLLLVVGVFATNAWMSWPAGLLEADPQKSYRSLIQGFLTIFGAIYALILAAMYFPIMFILSERANRMAQLEAPEPTVTAEREWREAMGLIVKMPAQLTRLAAVFAPLVAAPLSGLVGVLIK